MNNTIKYIPLRNRAIIWSLAGVVALAAVVVVVRNHGVNTPGVPTFTAAPERVLSTDSTSNVGNGLGQGGAVEAQPVRLQIEKIGVDAYVELLGITTSGNMASPQKFANAGWYKYGPTPGELGNAVIAGHLDDARGTPGVFYRLDELEIGDIVSVTNDDGSLKQFRVINKEIYAYNNAPLRDIFGPSDTAHLNLITCTGTWMPALKTYNQRLVVFTEEVS